MQRQDHLFYFFFQKLLMRHVFYGCILIIFQMHSSILDVLLRVWMIFFSSKALVRKILISEIAVGFALLEEGHGAGGWGDGGMLLRDGNSPGCTTTGWTRQARPSARAKEMVT